MGDRVIAYASGSRQHGMAFIGRAEIASLPMPVCSAQVGYAVSGVGPQYGEPPGYYVDLAKVEVFEEPVPIMGLRHRLRFVTNAESPKWAIRLVGGTLRICPEDFDTIVVASKSLRIVE